MAKRYVLQQKRLNSEQVNRKCLQDMNTILQLSTLHRPHALTFPIFLTTDVDDILRIHLKHTVNK